MTNVNYVEANQTWSVVTTSTKTATSVPKKDDFLHKVSVSVLATIVVNLM